MKVGTIRAGLAALMWLLASAALPAGQAQAQGVTCPSAANDETLNIVTSGGVTTCTNIGNAAATEGIEIRNNLVVDREPFGPGLGGERFGVSFRRITTGGNEQPTAAGCVGQCYNISSPGDGRDPDNSDGSSSGLVYDWGYGTGATTMVFCGAGLSAIYESCTVSFQFSDGTSGSFTVSSGSTVIPSFSLGGTVALPPAITSVTPEAVPFTGNWEVVVRGLNFDTVTNVNISNESQTFRIISSSELRFNASVSAYNIHMLPLNVTTPAATATYFISIMPAVVTIDTVAMPAGTQGTSYSAQITVSGGTRSASEYSSVVYGYSATGLPAGLSIDGSGAISGVPTQAGTFNVTVTVTDPGISGRAIWPATSSTKTLSLTIASSVTVTTSTLPGGSVGAPYTAPLAASGSTAPYTFAATGLPAGLAVSGSAITGTPTQAGTFTVAITATDSTTPTPIVSLATQLSLAIGAGGKLGQTITFTQPTGVVFKAGATVALKATASSGLAVAFASTTPAACTVAGTTATIVKAGTCTVKASQAGNATYAAAADVSVSFAIATTPSLSATAVVTPDKFSRPGETLTFVITLANTGGTTATGIRMSEPRLANLACAATTLAAGAKLNCQGTTLTTTSDLTAGSISITPQLTYTYAEATP